jgi:hypothetical protein
MMAAWLAWSVERLQVLGVPHGLPEGAERFFTQLYTELLDHMPTGHQDTRTLPLYNIRSGSVAQRDTIVHQEKRYRYRGLRT